ncbi:MAG: hypothetical protein CML31_05325 [Rhizobiales bacterium]|nr:hypothetical protein [Hoeflea sp.]MBG19374.1 hypothetical protein [Hyphomicrobiales bacterium]
MLTDYKFFCSDIPTRTAVDAVELDAGRSQKRKPNRSAKRFEDVVEDLETKRAIEKFMAGKPLKERERELIDNANRALMLRSLSDG